MRNKQKQNSVSCQRKLASSLDSQRAVTSKLQGAAAFPRHVEVPCHGFTLIEIIVVVLIISIIGIFATVNFYDVGQQRRAEEVARKIAMLLPMAQQQALLQPAILGLSINDAEHNYQFYQFTAEKWSEISDNRLFALRKIPTNVSITVETDAEEENASQPQIIFSPNGSMTTFKLLVGIKDNPAAFTIIGKANGEIQWVKNDH